MPDIQHKRGTRADLVTLAGSSGLLEGQHYNLTDTNQIAVATSTSAYYIVGAPAYALFQNGSSGNVSSITATETALTLSATVKDTQSLFSLSANVVTALAAADGRTFKVTHGSYLNQSGTSRSEFMSWIFQEDVKDSGSKAVYYLRGYDSGMSEDGFGVFTVSEDDEFTIKAGRTDGGGTAYQDANGTFLEFIEIL